MKISIKTLGCRANRYESDRIREKFADRAEFVDPGKPADVYIVNTCTVTAAADRKSRQAVNNLRNLSPRAKIVVFGCGPRVDYDKYKKMFNVDFVANEPREVEKFLNDLIRRGAKVKSPVSNRTRAVIKIQDGCNNFCSYCIIPRARGREVSYPVSRIMKEIKLKERQGFNEIVLTGIHIGSFRRGDVDLADLIRKILNETGIPRVRLSSIEPQNFSDKFLALLEEPRFCKHIHMSLQSGSDEILKKMLRRYDTALFADTCRRIREVCPDTAITTDVITGFPGETARHHKESLNFVRRIGFAKLHVFPFSGRPGTAAYSLPDQIPFNIRWQRANEFRKLGNKLRRKFIDSQLGRELDVLFEESRDGRIFTGWTQNYIKIKVAGGNLANKILPVRLEKDSVKSQDSS